MLSNHFTCVYVCSQDVQYTDIDTFDENKDFTWDEERFPGLPDYIRELQSKGMRMVLILVRLNFDVDLNDEGLTLCSEYAYMCSWWRKKEPLGTVTSASYEGTPSSPPPQKKK